MRMCSHALGELDSIHRNMVRVDRLDDSVYNTFIECAVCAVSSTGRFSTSFNQLGLYFYANHYSP